MKEKKVKRFLAIVMIMFAGALCINGSLPANSTAVHEVPVLESRIFTDTAKVNINNKVNIKDSLRLRLIDDVDRHIRKNFKIYDKNLPMYLVDHSLTYNIDLCFMMAQTTIETGFGTAGAGRPSARYSLFGVCKRYGNYNSAIEDYCKLLRKSYLGDRKTEHDLMKNYVTLGGARYAGNRGYERDLSAEYKRIRNRTQIYELWTELKNS